MADHQGGEKDLIISPSFHWPASRKAIRATKRVQHRQVKGPFEVKLEAAPLEQRAQRLGDAALLPQPAEDQVGPVGIVINVADRHGGGCRTETRREGLRRGRLRATFDPSSLRATAMFHPPVVKRNRTVTRKAKVNCQQTRVTAGLASLRTNFPRSEQDNTKANVHVYITSLVNIQRAEQHEGNRVLFYS